MNQEPPNNSSLPIQDPIALLGQMDIYLVDQLMRGRIHPGQRILDAGCGSGRNLAYFLRAGYDVTACDPSSGAIEHARQLAGRLAPALGPERFQQANIEELLLPDGHFDLVISNAVLHFAKDRAHFDSMLAHLWRFLRVDGIFFCRLASSIGLERSVQALGRGQFRLPDGSTRFLVTEEDLLVHTEQLGARLLDPIKTTNVQGQRCMTTWVLERPQ